METIETRTPTTLWERWTELKSSEPGLRARDAAKALGVSEAELVACTPGVTRVGDDWATILESIPTLGEVMALTRNEGVVSEVIGRYESVEIDRAMAMGQVVGHPIDLRVFLRGWSSGFALKEPVRGETRRSLQFFNAQGIAVHKVFLREGGDAAAFDALVEAHRRPEGEALTVQSAPTPAREKPDAEVDVAGLIAGWDALTDTHEFFGLLRRFSVAREQALRLAGAERAEPLAGDVLQTLLETASEREVSIMVFVGSPGVIQIRKGVPRRVKVLGDWINVLDPDFNLHAHAPTIARAWRVKKPSHGKTVTSVELFDAAGENLALIFGERVDGAWDSPGWSALAASLHGSQEAED